MTRAIVAIAIIMLAIACVANTFTLLRLSDRVAVLEARP